MEIIWASACLQLRTKIQHSVQLWNSSPLHCLRFSHVVFCISVEWWRWSSLHANPFHLHCHPWQQIRLLLHIHVRYCCVQRVLAIILRTCRIRWMIHIWSGSFCVAKCTWSWWLWQYSSSGMQPSGYWGLIKCSNCQPHSWEPPKNQQCWICPLSFHCQRERYHPSPGPYILCGAQCFWEDSAAWAQTKRQEYSSDRREQERIRQVLQNKNDFLQR